MRRVALILALSLTLSQSVALAATVKPTVKPTAKVTVKPTAKVTVTPTKKAVVKKRKPRKKISLSPSPKPAWPPSGFKQSGEVYAKVPNSKDLVGIISAKGNLASQIKSCSKYVCGAVQVASETGCTWWEVTSHLTSPENKILGNLVTILGTTQAQELRTILLISTEELASGARVLGIAVTCHHEAKSAEDVTRYTKVE